MSTSRGRRQQARFNPFLASLLVIVALVGSVVTLEAMGKTDLGLAKLWRADEVQANPNTLPVVMLTTSLRPGEVLEPQHCWDSENKRPMTIGIDKRVIEQRGFITDFRSFRGRVLARPKKHHEPLAEADFLPAGSPAGPQGLVPEGYLLTWVDESRVTGLGLLGFRDRFDLSMTLPVDEELARAARESLEARGNVKPEELLRLANSRPLQERRLLAQYGMVIETGIAQGKKTLAAVALHPDDVQATQDAVNGEEPIDCIARQTLAEEPERIVQEPIDPSEPFEWVTEGVGEVEVFQGKDKDVDTTRRAGETL